MLIELYDRLAKQKKDPSQASSAFMTAWDLIHSLLRLTYINWLDKEKVIQRIASSGNIDKPYNEIHRHEIQRINNANDKDLFGKIGKRVTGIDLKCHIENQYPSLWDGYTTATEVRHFHGHGKIYVKPSANKKSRSELTGILESMISVLDQVFAGDDSYKNARKGIPAPPIGNFSYDPITRQVTISEDEKLTGPTEW